MLNDLSHHLALAACALSWDLLVISPTRLSLLTLTLHTRAHAHTHTHTHTQDPAYNRALYIHLDFPDGSVLKNLPANAGDAGLIPGSWRPPGGGNGNSLQYSCLENSMERDAWWATVHGVAKSWTLLSDWACTCMFIHKYWVPVLCLVLM